jgi:soluble lytic murein transglycosylase-like protein
MYAKSMIEHVKVRIASGAWNQQLRLIPVALVLAVAALPFMLEPRFTFVPTASEPAADAVPADTPVSSMVRTAASVSTAAGVFTPGTAYDERRHAMVADYMARRFFVSRQVVLDLVKTAYAAGRQYNVDPMLLVAVMAVESSFNPIAESVAGAKGLMQIIPHYHLEKFVEFGGAQTIFEPRVNIAVGAKIIREYLQMYQGNLFTAMQMYAGALPDRDASYTHKVLNEKDRLDAILGLPRTERGGFAAYVPVAPGQPAVQQVPGGRVQMLIPVLPASTPQSGATQPDVTDKPVEPLAKLSPPLATASLAQ